VAWPPKRSPAIWKYGDAVAPEYGSTTFTRTKADAATKAKRKSEMLLRERGLTILALAGLAVATSSIAFRCLPTILRP
jgi:hypothetical protein